MQLPTGSARKTSGRASSSSLLAASCRESKRQQKQPPAISLHREAARTQDGAVDEPGALIVGDQPDALTGVGETAREAIHGGGFPGAEKAADHDVAGAHPSLPIMRSIVASRNPA